MKKLNKSLIAFSSLILSSYSLVALAQQEPAIACPGYEQPKTQLFSQRVGKKLQSAYDVFLNEELDEKTRTDDAIAMLKEIEPKEPFDKASVDRFLGQLILQQQGDDKMKEGLVILRGAVESKELNDKEQADLLKLVADLSLQEEEYEGAVKFYNEWMDFTCKEDGDVYLRLAKAYTETKEYDKVLVAADKAIATYEEPNKNPYALKINAHVETKNFDSAVDVAETLVELFPGEKNWWSQLGFFYMLTEDYTKALSTFSLAYKQGFLTKRSEFNALVQLYASSEMPYKSSQLREKYMESGMLQAEADDYASLANTLQLAREYKDAAKFYGRAASMSNNADHYRKQGVLLLTAEDYKGAISALNRALENGVESPGKVHFSLMEANFYAGNYRQANVHANEASKDPSMRRNANAWKPYIKQKADNRGIKI